VASSTSPRGAKSKRPVPPDPVTPGRLLAGRYRLEHLVASGGMAQVWQGTDEVLQRRVAVKLLHPHLAADATFVARFRQEAVAAARLAHPGIVSIYDTCSDEGIEAIVMELVDGRTVRERIDDPTPLEPWQAAGIIAQVAEALDAAHRTGLVHRDIKPANLLLCGDGRVKVADFGIAKAVEDADLTQPGAMVGTAKYLAPEQVRGEPVDARTDIYSLGIVLYELLCGRPPFKADTDAATALARLTTDPMRPRQVRSGIPKALEDIALRAMAREPADRYATASDLRAALLAAGAVPAPEPELTGATAMVPGLDATVAARVPGRPVAPAGAPQSFVRSERSWLIPTTIVVLVALALGLAGLLIDRSGAGNLFGALGGGDGSTPVTIASAQAFDPGGDGHENDASAPLAIDGDPTTSWRTEGYNDRDITKLKPGVGLVLHLDRSVSIDGLELDSPTNGWKIEVYVADGSAQELSDWGKPVATPDPLAAGRSTVDLDGAKGSEVLIWILDRGDAPGRAAAELRDVKVLTG
jgi:serine/threonine-protein kinase